MSHCMRMHLLFLAIVNVYEDTRTVRLRVNAFPS